MTRSRPFAAIPFLGAILVASTLAGLDVETSSCSDQAPLRGCPEIVATCKAPAPSYLYDVKPILDRSCNATCHAPGAGPWPFSTYQDVADWASLLQLDFEACTMPPADAGAPLTDGERTMLLEWIACGAPADPPTSLHPPLPRSQPAPL